MRRLILKEVHNGIGDNLMSFMGWKIIADAFNMKLLLDWNSLLMPVGVKAAYLYKNIEESVPRTIIIDKGSVAEQDPIPWHLFEDETIKTLVVQQSYQPILDRLVSYRPLSLSKENIIRKSRQALWFFFDEILDLPPPLINDLKHVMSSYEESCSMRPRIGIHLRIGSGLDHVFVKNNASLLLEKRDIALVKKALAEVKDALDNDGYDYSQAVFALISDSEPQQLRKIAEELFERNGYFLHIAGNPRHMRITHFKNDDWLKLISDIMLLASCERMYISVNSNLSRIAALMASEWIQGFRYWFIDLNDPPREGTIEELFFKKRNSII
jgi:hypothetical protein